MSDAIFDLHAKVSADASPFNKAMDSTASSVTSSLGAIQSAAHTFIGNGVVQAFTRAVNVANEFGQIIADISSISDLNMQHLSNSIRNMENVYGKASRIGNTVYEAISSGIEGTEDEYIKFAKVVGQTSKSIRADIETTGNVLTTLSNAYGMSVSEVSKLADMLFVTVREGKAQGNQLAHTLGLVTNTAAEAGVSLAEMSAVISILSRTQSASQSMIAFNQMLNGLIKPTQEAQREAKKWGIEIGATALQTKGLTSILTEMHDKIGGNVEAINAILGNIRAMRAGTALTGKQFQNFLSVLHTAEKEIGTGVAFEAFTKQTNTAQQALENFETQVDKTFITVGKDFEPLTRLVSGFAEGILKAFGSGEGGSLGAVGRWATYILVIQKTISAIKSTYTATRDIAHKLSEVTDRTKEASAAYADNMERANRAIHNAQANTRKLFDKSAPQPPNPIKIEKDAKSTIKGNAIIQSQAAIEEARRRVVQASKDVHNLTTPYLKARAKVERARTGSDYLKQQFLDDRDLRIEQEKVVKDSTWAASSLIKQLPSPRGKNKKYYIKLQEQLDEAKAKAISDLQTLTESEAKSRNLYYKSEATLAKTETEFNKAYTGYAQAQVELKHAQRELQSLISAQRGLMRGIKTGVDSVPDFKDDKARRLWNIKEHYAEKARIKATQAYRPDHTATEDELASLNIVESKASKYEQEYIKYINKSVKTLTKEDKERSRAHKELRRSTLSEQQKADITERYNRRMGKHYKSYEDITTTTAQKWKKSFSSILGDGGALSKLYNGFHAVTAALAAWETGWAIGTAIREKFGTDDMFISDKSKRDAEIAEMENAAIVRKSTMRLTEQLHNRKLIDASEYARLNAEIALTSTVDETMVLYKTLQDKLNKAIAEVPSKPKTSTELVKEAKDAYNKDVKSINDKYNKGERDATGTEIAKADKMLLQLLSSKENTLLNSEDSRVAVMQLFKSGFHSQQKRDEVATTLVNAFMEKQSELSRQDAVIAAYSRDISRQPYNKVSTEDAYKLVYNIMDKLATVRRGDVETREMRNAEIRSAYVTHQQEAIRGAFASHEDKIASKDIAIKQYTSALSTPKSSTLDATEIDTAIDNYNARLKTFNNIRDTIAKVVKDAKTKRKSNETIDTITAEGRQKLGNMLTELDALEKGIQYSVNAVIDKNAKDIDNIAQELKGEGLKEGSEKFTEVMVNAISKRIASANKLMASSKNPVVKGYYNKIAEDLEKQKKDVYEAQFEARSNENEALFEAGSLTEMQYKQAQRDILHERKKKGLYKGSETQYRAESLAAYYAVDEAKLNEIKDANDKRAKRRSVLRDTGRLSEEKAAKQEASDALKIINAINRQLGAEKKYLKGNLSDTERKIATKRVTDLTERRTEYRGIHAKALLKAEDAVLKFRTGLLSTIKGFADMRDGVKMTNDALWHSVNLASRMGRMQRSKPYMVETTGIPNRYKADRMRKQAQGAVSASVDSWIMSQKYAEANVGKTVTDIFKFMQQNNTIVVRKQ